MTHLRYNTTDALESLRRTVADHLDWYYAPVRELLPNSLGGFRELKVEASAFGDRLVIDDKRPSETDPENALIVYDALSDTALAAGRADFQIQGLRWIQQCPDMFGDAIGSGHAVHVV